MDITEKKVVAMSENIVLPGRAVDEVVDTLRELLACAERGEIVAVAVAAVGANMTARTQYAYKSNLNGIALMGVATRLQYRLSRDCFEQ